MSQRILGFHLLLILSIGAICTAYREDPSFVTNFRSTRESWRIHTRPKKGSSPLKYEDLKDTPNAASISSPAVDLQADNTTVIPRIEVEPLDWEGSRDVELFRDAHSNEAQEPKLGPRIYIRYAANLGLGNQIYSHINVLALAARLGAEVVLSPAVYRSSFKHAFDSAEANWTLAPTSSILNVEAIIAFWRARGITVHRTPYVEDLEALPPSQPVEPQLFVHPALVTQLCPAPLTSMQDLVALVRSSVLTSIQSFSSTHLHKDADAVCVDVSCIFQRLRTGSDLQAVSLAARSLTFAAHLEHLASRVSDALHAKSPNGYHGVHLRVEGDAMSAGFASAVAGAGASTAQAMVNVYVKALKDAAGEDHLPVYVASGMLGYGKTKDFDALAHPFVRSGAASVVYYKEKLLDKDTLAGLHSEARALVDFLVLCRSKHFVGVVHSSFSLLVQEKRLLHGKPRQTSTMLGGAITEILEASMRLSE